MTDFGPDICKKVQEDEGEEFSFAEIWGLHGLPLADAKYKDDPNAKAQVKKSFEITEKSFNELIGKINGVFKLKEKPGQFVYYKDGEKAWRFDKEFDHVGKEWTYEELLKIDWDAAKNFCKKHKLTKENRLGRGKPEGRMPFLLSVVLPKLDRAHLLPEKGKSPKAKKIKPNPKEAADDLDIVAIVSSRLIGETTWFLAIFEDGSMAEISSREWEIDEEILTRYYHEVYSQLDDPYNVYDPERYPEVVRFLDGDKGVNNSVDLTQQ